jgi:hypothetical protein
MPVGFRPTGLFFTESRVTDYGSRKGARHGAVDVASVVCEKVPGTVLLMWLLGSEAPFD